MDVQFKGIRKYYDKKLILDIDDLFIEGNKVYSLIGKNGIGKTTLLKILAGLDHNYEGKVEFYQQKKPCFNAERHITMVFQTPYMFDNTVWNNIAYGLKVRKEDKQIINKRVEETLELMDLTHMSQKNALKLSAGQIQRVALARAIAFRPSVLLLDEPTASVDPEYSEMMINLIKDIHEKKGTTIIVVTHKQEEVKRLSGNVLEVVSGKIIKRGE